MRSIPLVSSSLILCACATTLGVNSPFSRCDVSPEDWSLLETPPQDHASLLVLAGNPETNSNKRLYWFGSLTDRVLLCTAPLRKTAIPGGSPGCHSTREIFSRQAGAWHNTGEDSFTMCGYH